MGQLLDQRVRLYQLLTALDTVDVTIVKAGTGRPTGYPYITLEFFDETEEDADEVNKYQVFKWRIRVYANMDKDVSSGGAEWAEETVLTVVDEMKDEINADPTLTGYADDMNWEYLKGVYAPGESGDMRVIEGILRIYILKQMRQVLE